jgi:hypothetical protein
MALAELALGGQVGVDRRWNQGGAPVVDCGVAGGGHVGAASVIDVGLPAAGMLELWHTTILCQLDRLVKCLTYERYA